MFSISIAEMNMTGLGVFCFSIIAIAIPVVLKIPAVNGAVGDLSISVILRIVFFFVYSRNTNSTLIGATNN